MNKAWDRVGLGCGWSEQAGQGWDGSGVSGLHVSDQSLLSPNIPEYFCPSLMIQQLLLDF